MKTSKVRIGTVAGVLALPLIAILAMVMFFSFSQSGPEQAQAANQGSVTAMRIDVPTNAEVGSKFTVSIVADLTPADPISGFGVSIIVDDAFGTPGVSYNGDGSLNETGGNAACLVEVKLRPTDNILSKCDSVTPILTGGHAWSVLTDFASPGDALLADEGAKVVLVNTTYSCNTVGTHKLSLGAQTPAGTGDDPDGAIFADLTGGAIFIKTESQDVDTDGDTTADFTVVADTATITCTPPAETINVNVTDSVLATKLTNTCLLVSVTVIAGSPPAPVNKPFDVVSDNNAIAACDSIGPIKGDLSDSNPAVGQIDIAISGKNREAFGDDWSVQQVQTQDKYNVDPTKFVCDLSAGKCEVPITNQLKDGVLNVTINNNVTGGPLTEAVCVNIEPGSTQECTSTGSISVNRVLGSYTVTIKPEKLAASSLQLAAGTDATLNCDLSKSTLAGRTCDLKFSFEGQKVFHLKTPSLSNLFLSNQQGEAKAGLEVEVGTTIAPQTCRAGTDVALFTNNLSLEPASQNPKGDAQSVAAFEMTIRYDPQWVCVNVVPGDYWFLQANKTNPFASGNVRAAAQAIADSADPVAGGGAPITLSTGAGGVVCFIDDKNDGLQPTGMARIGCVVTKSQLKDIDQTLPLAYVLVKPQPEVYNQIIPNQENGIVTMILNSGCNLADLEGHAIDSSGCDDSVLTIRWLEADFNGDCVVDVIDQQAVSMRWGASVGSLLYDARMDTMPYGNIKGDGLINIKDVQFAYGRAGSVCSEQNRFHLKGAPNPAQDPVPNK